MSRKGYKIILLSLHYCWHLARKRINSFNSNVFPIKKDVPGPGYLFLMWDAFWLCWAPPARTDVALYILWSLLPLASVTVTYKSSAYLHPIFMLTSHGVPCPNTIFKSSGKRFFILAFMFGPSIITTDTKEEMKRGCWQVEEGKTTGSLERRPECWAPFKELWLEIMLPSAVTGGHSVGGRQHIEDTCTVSRSCF